MSGMWRSRNPLFRGVVVVIPPHGAAQFRGILSLSR
jgi:hypothetical protein